MKETTYKMISYYNVSIYISSHIFKSGNTKCSAPHYDWTDSIIIVIIPVTNTHTQIGFCAHYRRQPMHTHTYKTYKWKFIFMCAWWYEPNVSIFTVSLWCGWNLLDRCRSITWMLVWRKREMENARVSEKGMCMCLC